jgi:BirA family biotin operon repressor/biotin-[acetyl-CoA-carboxylase] ligase
VAIVRGLSPEHIVRLGHAFEEGGIGLMEVTYNQRAPETWADTARAIEAVAGVQVGIKWVNDLYINRRKVCGILCEDSMDFESGQLEYAVLGIGVNVAAMRFPEELSAIATSIENECGRPVSRNRLIAEISNQLNALYGQLDSLEFMAESRKRSVVIGRDVQDIRGGESFPAKALDIDDQGCLVIRTEAGVSRVNSGEVSLKL